MTDRKAELIVCERTGRWATALRRELGNRPIRVHETRSLTECWHLLAENPAGFAVVELADRVLDELLGRMSRLETDFPFVRVAVVADRALADYERLIREAGAVHFTCSPRLLRPLAELAARHLDQVPEPDRSPAETIWSTLPWKAQASMQDRIE